MNTYLFMSEELARLEAKGNLRVLPQTVHEGRYITMDGRRMLNLSSNDYLGLAADVALRDEFLACITPETFLPSASSSRLLTGNFPVFEQLEQELARLYGTEAALTFGSGYHANSGILPAVADSHTLILADKLVHASLIDGIRLSGTDCIRFKHNDMNQLERLLQQRSTAYRRTLIVTESLFSMDGDEAPLQELVELKHRYPGILLYVDEAHAFGVRGKQGLGCAEEVGCLPDIDFLVGTFGKAAASAGAFVVCNHTVRNYLVNRMRPFIFTTALPPVVAAWTLFVLRRLPDMMLRRNHLAALSTTLRQALADMRQSCPSTSHIIPIIEGDSRDATRRARLLQRQGFYVLPVRPPTVPEGTSRIRISLTADMTMEEMAQLLDALSTPA